MGPMGSGKTTALGPIEIYRRALMQPPCRDGVRRSRWAVVRNTTPQLIDTTIKTFREWLPDVFGSYKENPRPQMILDRIRADDGSPVHIEIMFRALDKVDQVKDLLSLELTGAFFNEIREIGKTIFDAMTGRIGRYPRKEDLTGQPWFGIWGDFNPCDTDHWLYKFIMEEKVAKCKTCKNRMGGMVLYPSRDPYNSEKYLPEGQRFCPMCGKDFSNAELLVDFFKQPSALSPEAENLNHLSPDYYSILMMGKSRDFIRVYVEGEWGFVGEGKPVYPDWVTSLHVAEKDLPITRHLPLWLGFDYGLNPAVVFCQIYPDGRFYVLDELCGKDIVFRDFLTKIVKPHLNQYYQGMDVILVGDPSGENRMGIDGNTFFKELKAHGLVGRKAPSNKIGERITAVTSLLTKPLMNYGTSDKPDMKHPFQVSPKCTTLIRGFNGGYHRKRVAVVGIEKFKEEPEKTFESHIHEALQYVALEFERNYSKNMNYMVNPSWKRHPMQNMKAPPISAFV